MLASHGACYGFFSIHLERLGCSAAFIGGAWALASGSEIVAMLYSAALFARFPLERVLLVSMAVAALRWFILGWVGSPAVILATQLLHALTYGTFHMASILYVDRESPPGGKNLGQAVNSALTYGLGLMTGFLISGQVYARAGSFAAFQVWGRDMGGYVRPEPSGGRPNQPRGRLEARWLKSPAPGVRRKIASAASRTPAWVQVSRSVGQTVVSGKVQPAQ
jgi:PPP family 3-phenylpropionic acid transporter